MRYIANHASELRPRKIVVSNVRQFFGEFWNRPRHVGAFAPTSNHLAAFMVEKANVWTARTVMELGAGTGAITRHIVRSLPEYGHLVAFEINPAFAKTLKRQFPTVKILNNKAEHFELHLRRLGIGACDAVIATLPWYWMEKEARSRLLALINGSLRLGGTFTTCLHIQSFITPANKAFCQEVKNAFGNSEISRAVWRNLMPAVVLTATKQ